MKRCMSVSFMFKGKEYHAIVRKRICGNNTLYHVRVMNHQLDMLLSRAGLSDCVSGREGFQKLSDRGEAALLYNTITECIERQSAEVDALAMAV